MISVSVLQQEEVHIIRAYHCVAALKQEEVHIITNKASSTSEINGLCQFISI